MKWFAKAKDEPVNDEMLQTPCEFPRLGLVLAQELIRIAYADCPERATRTTAFREARLSAHKMVTCREISRLSLKYLDQRERWRDVAVGGSD